jgi:DNA-binding winged helix-turn-helix (wHTH) protein/type II secretory pathway predicted ATPase ExeA
METEKHASPRPELQIDRRRGIVTSRGRELVLRAKAWEVLLLLAERPDELVSVADLRRGVWRDVTVAAKTVRNVVGELRQALAEPDGSEAIETTKRRGYRLVARVTEIAARRAVEAKAGAPAPLGAALLPRPELLNQLKAAWHAALRPTATLALIVGEPGAGKTTLLRWFEEQVAAAADESADAPAMRPLLVFGGCVDRTAMREPYGPLLMAIGAVLAARPAAQAVLRRLAPTWLLQFPGLLDGNEAERLHNLCAGSSPARRSREGVALLEALAAEQPLIVAIEDLHWADPDTLDVLGGVARSAPSVPLFLVGTLRRYPRANAEAAARLEYLRRLATELSVQPFNNDELHAYLTLRLGTATLPDGLVPFLQERSSGNPLVLQSLCRQLLESGSLQRGAAGWQLHTAATWSAPTLAADVAGVIATHLHRLPPQLGRVLEAASLLGEEFSSEALTEVLGEPPAAIELALKELTRQEILRRLIDGRIAFVHVVHRQVVRSQIDSARRAALEAAVAAQLVQRPAGPGESFEPARIATHFAAAGDWAQATQYFEYAAHVANSRLDYIGAARWLETALQCSTRIEPSPVSERHAAQLQLLLANMMVGQMPALSPQAAAHFDRAAALFEKHGENVEAFRARLGFTLAELLRGYYTSARQGADRLLAAADQGEPGMAAAAHAYAGLVVLFSGRIDAACTLLEDGLRQPYVPDLPRLLDLPTFTRLVLAIGQVVGGEPEAASRARDVALAAYDRDHLPMTHALTMLLPAIAGSLVRDVGIVRTMIAEASRLADLYVLFRLQPVVAFLRHWVDWRATQREESLDAIQAALSAQRDSGSRWMLPHLEVLLAEALLEANRVKDARRAVERGLTSAEESGEALCQAELLRLRAQCLIAAAGEYSDYTRVGVVEARRWAEAELRRAVEVARGQGAGLFERRARQALRQLAGGGARAAR